MARIAVIGTGYVGLTTLVGMSQLGHQCVGYDIDGAKIRDLQKGVVSIFEPGLTEGLIESIEKGNLAFTTELKAAVQESDFVFICVSTPEGEDGAADISRVLNVATTVSNILKSGAIVITKSTVPVGTGLKVRERISREDVDVASNPEFLREGSSLRDFHSPDRIVVGAEREGVSHRVLTLYEEISAKKIMVDLLSAELIKYASNSFLAVKLSFVNEITQLSRAVGANSTQVIEGMGSDSRIGSKFMASGPGWGGSCFPKDTSAILSMAKSCELEMETVDAAVRSNFSLQSSIAHRITEITHKSKIYKESAPKKTIGFWGLAFKSDTDDLRESPAMRIIDHLTKENFQILGFDYKAKPMKSEKLKVVDSLEDACRGADVLVIATEWKEFGRVNPAPYLELMANKNVVDLRNILNRSEWESAGASFYSIGREL
jgi:UDPglucose 6-dehydrogenase